MGNNKFLRADWHVDEKSLSVSWLSLIITIKIGPFLIILWHSILELNKTKNFNFEAQFTEFIL